MAPPHCACGNHKLSKLSEDLQRVWAHREGRSWFWHTDQLAYFLFCSDCHLTVWPEDRRPRRGNRYTTFPSQTSLASALNDAGRRRQLVAGYLYLRESPPALLDPRVQVHVISAPD